MIPMIPILCLIITYELYLRMPKDGFLSEHVTGYKYMMQPVIASLSPPDAKMEKSLIVIYPLFCNEKMEISGCPAMNSVNSLLKMMN